MKQKGNLQNIFNIYNKGLISKIYKELQNSKAKNLITQFSKWSKGLTFLQRRRTNGQQLNDKTFHITSYQKNVSQNHNKLSHHIYQDGHYKKIKDTECS